MTTATEIRFYHLERQSADQALPGLVSKALETGRRVVIRVANDREVERINEHLWTYSPDSFLPHGSKKDGFADRQPVWITAQDENPNKADVLILTQDADCAMHAQFALCCEILDGKDESAVSEARARWKKYKDEGFTITYWQQGAKGWEKKSG